MKNANTPDVNYNFSYRIDFRYKKFSSDLKPTDFIISNMTITVGDPVQEPLQRDWISIIEALNPDYHKTEVINVTAIEN